MRMSLTVYGIRVLRLGLHVKSTGVGGASVTAPLHPWWVPVPIPVQVGPRMGYDTTLVSVPIEAPYDLSVIVMRGCDVRDAGPHGGMAWFEPGVMW